MKMTFEASQLIMRFPNQASVHGIVMAREANLMRVAVEGVDDVVVLRLANSVWYTEAGEPVELMFEWRRHPGNEQVSEADCICPPDLAARLLELLLNGGEESRSSQAAPETRGGWHRISPKNISTSDC